MSFYFSFEFVKASGSEIVPVNLTQSQKINGKVLKHITASGPVYVRCLYDIEDTDRGNYKIVKSNNIVSLSVAKCKIK